jgi:hypothetical protein
VPTRTKNSAGAYQTDEEGRRTFNEDTIPDEDEVAFLITDAKNDMESEFGTEICDAAEEAREQATSATALYAAMLVELTYFPEQVKTGQSPYPMLKELHDTRVARLRQEIEEQCGDVPGGGDEGAGGGSRKPDYAYPKDVSNVGLSGPSW